MVIVVVFSNSKFREEPEFEKSPTRFTLITNQLFAELIASRILSETSTVFIGVRRRRERTQAIAGESPWTLTSPGLDIRR